METLIQFVQDQSWFNIVTAAIALASAITAITPTPKANSTCAKIYAVIDFLALNIGKAKDTGKK